MQSARPGPGWPTTLGTHSPVKGGWEPQRTKPLQIRASLAGQVKAQTPLTERTHTQAYTLRSTPTHAAQSGTWRRASKEETWARPQEFVGQLTVLAWPRDTAHPRPRTCPPGGVQRQLLLLLEVANLLGASNAIQLCR